MSFRRNNKETNLDRTLMQLNRYGQGWHIDQDGDMVQNTESEDWDTFTTNAIAEYRAQSDKLNKASAVYQRADRIITGESELVVSVIDDPDMDTPARNNGKEVHFNANLIENLDSDTLTSLSGLNYHELAHLLFTPRAGSNLGQFVEKNRLVRAFNVLEEGRIETLLTNKYPATRLFLEATISDYILKSDPNEWAEQFLVVTGRKHLALEMRQLITDKFVAKYGVEVARDVHNLIHEYRTLAFPRDFDKAKELCLRLSEYVGLDDLPNPNGGNGNQQGEEGEGNQQATGRVKVSSPCDNNRQLPHKGRPRTGKEQEALQKAEGDNPIKPESIESQEVSEHDTKTNGQGGLGDYVGEERDFSEESKVMAEKINRRLKEIGNNERVKREVKDTRKAIGGSDEVRTSIPKATLLEMQPDTKAINYARKFGQELERLARDNDPHWDKFLPTGKLNVSRTMNPDVNAIGQMFDVWDTGNENTEIETVILIDNSSSMGGSMRPVCETAWIIKRGVEAIEGNATVFSFSHESKVMYDRKERAKPNAYRHIHSTGSTNPIEGLLEAQRIFDNTTKSNKILFVVTDGEWANEELCNKVISDMKNAHVLVCVVYIGYYKGILELMKEAREGNEESARHLKNLRHGAHIFNAVGDTRDVLPIASEVVKQTMRGRVSA